MYQRYSTLTGKNMSIINIFQNIINETQTIDDSNLRIKLHQVTLKKKLLRIYSLYLSKIEKRVKYRYSVPFKDCVNFTIIIENNFF